MASATLVKRLADATGSTLDEAGRLVDELGEANARQLLQGGEDSSSIWPSTRGGQALTGGAIAGGTAVGWNSMDALDSRYSAQEAQAQTEATQTTADMYGQFMEDLDPGQAQQFAEMFNQSPANQNNNDDDGFWESMDTQTKIIIALVIVAIVYVVTQDDASIPSPTVIAGGR